MERGLPLPEPAELDLLNAGPEILKGFERLPQSLQEAAGIAAVSAFIREHVPEQVLKAYVPERY